MVGHVSAFWVAVKNGKTLPGSAVAGEWDIGTRPVWSHASQTRPLCFSRFIKLVQSNYYFGVTHATSSMRMLFCEKKGECLADFDDDVEETALSKNHLDDFGVLFCLNFFVSRKI